MKILAKRIKPRVEYQVLWDDGSETWIGPDNFAEGNQLVSEFNRAAREAARTHAEISPKNPRIPGPTGLPGPLVTTLVPNKGSAGKKLFWGILSHIG